jgi:hypothetical protein
MITAPPSAASRSNRAAAHHDASAFQNVPNRTGDATASAVAALGSSGARLVAAA